jgi:hypothetical protein
MGNNSDYSTALFLLARELGCIECKKFKGKFGKTPCDDFLTLVMMEEEECPGKEPFTC